MSPRSYRRSVPIEGPRIVVSNLEALPDPQPLSVLNVARPFCRRDGSKPHFKTAPAAGGPVGESPTSWHSTLAVANPSSEKSQKRARGPGTAGGVGVPAGRNERGLIFPRPPWTG